jgi:hypothetical protein
MMVKLPACPDPTIAPLLEYDLLLIKGLAVAKLLREGIAKTFPPYVD